MKLRKAVVGCAALVLGFAITIGVDDVDLSHLTVGQHSATDTSGGRTAITASSPFDTMSIEEGVKVQGKTSGKTDLHELTTFQSDLPKIIMDFAPSPPFAQGNVALSHIGDPNEIALVTANNDALAFTLTATGPSTAIWIGQGDSPGFAATTSGGGIGNVTDNPFNPSNTAPTVTSPEPAAPLGGGAHVYPINPPETAVAVPEPATITYLAIGAVGLVFVRRRIKK
jgi:hypothetical protein